MGGEGGRREKGRKERRREVNRKGGRKEGKEGRKKWMESRFVSHQCLLHLRVATLTVIIALQTMTHPLLMAVVAQICKVCIVFASNKSRIMNTCPHTH